jgi:hypothetical protein
MKVFFPSQTYVISDSHSKKLSSFKGPATIPSIKSSKNQISKKMSDLNLPVDSE